MWQARDMRNSGADGSDEIPPTDDEHVDAAFADLDWSDADELEQAPEAEAPPAWFGRGRCAIFAVAAICVAVFIAANVGSDAGTRSRLLALGAISYSTIGAGELWRLLTAVFLHFDIGHLLANMSALAVLGPPLAHQVGGARFLVVFLLGGIGANVVSHLLAPTVGLKAGASGGIAAVLGALGAQGVRPQRRTRFKQWQILGALAAFYGLMIGFGPGRDNVAHLAGAVLGFLIGRVIEPLPPETRPIVPPEPPHPSRSD
jgi:rhomboid protease GluP